MDIKAIRQLDLSGLPITYETVIPEDWRDAMGHMNVMWYTHLFSCAAGGLFPLYGLSKNYFGTGKSGTFVLANHIRYLAEVLAGQKVTIRSRALGRSDKRGHFMHFIYNEDRGVVSATGEFVNTHVDMSTRRASPFPQHICEAFDKLKAQHDALGWEAPVCGALNP